ncbi:hypothetical protein [Peribacillus frigoritolerans]|uniref:hypothetical protein n=1 Tax=Peribacillus frigoritolerans TaxID=450367 RepID=UPI002416FECB|nr:hypothetical protein [Peribacillus frigoritolerans]MDG4850521.1 hypothetical protein [Peribacillus frigoritolerans]
MADEKKFVEIRFRLPIVDFEEYVIEANEITKTLSYDVSPTSRIRADAIKQAEIKRQNRQKLESIYKQPSVMDVFEGL